MAHNCTPASTAAYMRPKTYSESLASRLTSTSYYDLEREPLEDRGMYYMRFKYSLPQSSAFLSADASTKDVILRAVFARLDLVSRGLLSACEIEHPEWFTVEESRVILERAESLGLVMRVPRDDDSLVDWRSSSSNARLIPEGSALLVDSGVLERKPGCLILSCDHDNTQTRVRNPWFVRRDGEIVIDRAWSDHLVESFFTSSCVMVGLSLKVDNSPLSASVCGIDSPLLLMYKVVARGEEEAAAVAEYAAFQSAELEVVQVPIPTSLSEFRTSGDMAFLRTLLCDIVGRLAQIDDRQLSRGMRDLLGMQTELAANWISSLMRSDGVETCMKILQDSRNARVGLMRLFEGSYMERSHGNRLIYFRLTKTPHFLYDVEPAAEETKSV